MNCRRLVGIDLGIASAHTVRVLDESGEAVAKRKAWPTVESLSEVEIAALAGCPAGTRLEVVVEPTGPAWLPIAVFFASRGHVVYRVSSAKAADLRRFLSRHTKTNGIDADTLARLPLFDPAGLQPLQLPGVERAALDRRVRACDRLTQAAAEHKVRIKDLVRQLLPMTPLTGDLGVADLAVLERWADPNALLKAGVKRVTALIVKASNNHQGVERAAQWIAAAEASVALYGGHPAVAFADLAAEVATEVRLLRATQAELAGHATEREICYRWVDPAGLARSLPGLAEVGGPAVVAAMGNPDRFGHGKQFRAFAGLTPRASETGDTDRKGQPMSKAGSSLLRTTLVRAADHARKLDPQLARIYYVQMVERGKDHLGALCVVAASPNERGPSCAAACPTSSATPTAAPSPPTKPRPSSSSTGPSPPRSAPADGARRWGRPPRKSSQDSPSHALEAQAHGATFPTRHRPRSSPITSTDEPLDSRSSIGNQAVECVARRHPPRTCRRGLHSTAESANIG